MNTTTIIPEESHDENRLNTPFLVAIIMIPSIFYIAYSLGECFFKKMDNRHRNNDLVVVVVHDETPIKFNNIFDDKELNTECTICLDKIGLEYTKLECGHVFHKDCIEKWAKNCPICRHEIE